MSTETPPHAFAKPLPLDVYVDGSYRNERTLFGFIVVEGNKARYQERGELTGPVTAMHQIGGELKAVVNAVQWAKKNAQPIVICYDYVGIECWVADLFGKKPWKTKNPWTAKYRHFMLANSDWVVRMKRVKAHSGHHWNETVDAFVGATETDITPSGA